ncbi:MFS transporter [Phenylobacterium sp.]|uniref:MFS transporter n=1 Tax=Phenylobacterium sp. TaxID=1871053 RepID=UPI002CBE615D|nr:MFS transporter [Phenylobacterium sp.]HLZ74456.1 MFS transporter [Phenylobacterium sp.]
MTEPTTDRALPGGPHKPPHPSVYLLLFMPYGAAGGYVTVTLAYMLTKAGASVAQVATLVALSILPSTYKVLWAPLADTTLTPKIWYRISVIVTVLGFLAFAVMPYTVALLPVFGVVIFAMNTTSTFSAMSVERLMAYDTPPSQKGRAGGWAQAGNLGGTGLGGGVGLVIAQHSSHAWLPAITLALLSLGCMLGLRGLSDPAHEVQGGYLTVLKTAAKDVWSLMITRLGLLAAVLVLLPVGTGAASNLWAAIAGDWGASGDEVALIGGGLSGVVCIIGSVAGGYLCDRMDRKLAYLLFGLGTAAAAVAMAMGPRTALAFIVFATIYNLILGFVYGGFSAVALEAIGKGAAATKYNMLASLSNIPILAMTALDGWAQGRWGSGGMLVFEASLGVAGAVAFAVIVYSTRGLTWRGVFGGLLPKPA